MPLNRSEPEGKTLNSTEWLSSHDCQLPMRRSTHSESPHRVFEVSIVTTTEERAPDFSKEVHHFGTLLLDPCQAVDKNIA